METLKKNDNRDLRNRRKCATRSVYVNELKQVCKDRAIWMGIMKSMGVRDQFGSVLFTPKGMA